MRKSFIEMFKLGVLLGVMAGIGLLIALLVLNSCVA